MTQEDTDRSRPVSRPEGDVSVAETAERLGLTPDAIRARLHSGTLEGDKIAGE
jgi:hypothetical protein